MVKDKDNTLVVEDTQKMSAVVQKKRSSLVLGGVFLLLAIIIGSFYVFNSRNKDDNSEFEIAVVERGDLVAIVGATGIVEPNQSVELNWKTTGRVENVYVAVNDIVQANEKLAELADVSLPRSVILAQADLVFAKRTLEDLVSSNTESAIAYTNLLKAEQKRKEAKDNRDKWNYNGASEERIDIARIDLLDAEKEYIQAQLAFDGFSDLNDDDPQKEKALETRDETKTKRDEALQALDTILGKTYDQQVAEDFAGYDVALAQLEDAQREWERVKDGPNSSEISAAEANVAAAEAAIALSKIEAPLAGTVTKAFPKVGDEVSIGTRGFRIDDLSELFVKVEVSEIDINQVAIGQKADLTFDAIIGETFTGKVTEVSSVGSDNGGGVDFLVTLKIKDPSAQIHPGMTAAVNIIVNEIEDVLSVPNRAVRLKEGQPVVSILMDGEIREVKIELGSSSDMYSEVVSGDIKEGDLIVLNPPFEFANNGVPPAFMR